MARWLGDLRLTCSGCSPFQAARVPVGGNGSGDCSGMGAPCRTSVSSMHCCSGNLSGLASLVGKAIGGNVYGLSSDSEGHDQGLWPCGLELPCWAAMPARPLLCRVLMGVESH